MVIACAVQAAIFSSLRSSTKQQLKEKRVANVQSDGSGEQTAGMFLSLLYLVTSLWPSTAPGNCSPAKIYLL